MVGARTPRLILSALAVSMAALMGALAGGPIPTAVAATPHRAAVIVDTGAGVHRIVITFTEDSITGIDALQRAGASPVVYNFGGQGGAVCRIFGVGRDAGPNCLGGQDGDNRYWAYFRAPAGSSSFTYSSIGAGSARVHDGDVEGWRFGTGAAPAFVSLQSLLPPTPTSPPTTPPTRPPATNPTGSSNAGPGPLSNDPLGQDESATPSKSDTLPVTGADTPPNGTATTNPDGTARDQSGKQPKASGGDSTKKERALNTALASSDDGSGGGSSASSLIWFAVLLVAIVVAIFVVRRARRRTT